MDEVPGSKPRFLKLLRNIREQKEQKNADFRTHNSSRSLQRIHEQQVMLVRTSDKRYTVWPAYWASESSDRSPGVCLKGGLGTTSPEANADFSS